MAANVSDFPHHNTRMFACRFRCPPLEDFLPQSIRDLAAPFSTAAISSTMSTDIEVYLIWTDNAFRWVSHEII
jgi:hypothetical protein